MDGGFFKGTSTEQDQRFKDKESLLLKKMKFPASFDQKVDMNKVEVSVLKPWIARKVIELLGFEDDVLIEYINSLLEDESNRILDAKKMQLNLTGFMEKQTPVFMNQLWNMLLSAQANPLKVPTELLEEKKREMREREQQQAVERRKEEAIQDVRQRERGERAHNRAGNESSRGGPPFRGGRGGGGGGFGGRGRGRGGYRYDNDRGYSNRGRSRSRSRSPPPARGGYGRTRNYSRSPTPRGRSYSRSRSRSRSPNRSRSPPCHRRRARYTPSRSRSRSRSRSPAPRRRSYSRSLSPRPSRNSRRYRSRSHSRSPPPRSRHDRSPSPDRRRDSQNFRREDELREEIQSRRDNGRPSDPGMSIRGAASSSRG